MSEKEKMMSCWTEGINNRGAGAQAVHAPHQIGAVIASPGKCPVCGWYMSRSQACTNKRCGTRQANLQAVGAGAQPGTQGAQDWEQLTQAAIAAGNEPWEGVRLSRSAYRYLKTTGIPPEIAERAFDTQPAQVWMYLPRCPACKAWVSPRIGMCRNPRCAKGKEKAQVTPITGWSWPPKQRNLLHLEQALRSKHGIDPPQGHAAWHAQAHDLAERVPGVLAPLAEKYAYLKDAEALVRVGSQNGWLSPEDPAFDMEAQDKLYETLDAMLNQMPRAELCGLVAWEGRWEGVALLDARGLHDFKDWLNPVTSKGRKADLASRAHVLAELYRFAPAQGGRPRGLFPDLVMEGIGAALDSISKGEGSPALPPRGWEEFPDEFRNDLLMELEHRYPWLQTTPPTGTVTRPEPGAEAYLWLVRSRLGGVLSSQQRDRAIEVLERSYEDLGYDTTLLPESAVLSPLSVGNEDLIAVVDNALSPAEARGAIRQRKRAERSVSQAWRHSADGAPARSAGAQFRKVIDRQGQRRFRANLVDGKDAYTTAWVGRMKLPAMYYEEIRQFAAGARCGVVANFSTDKDILRWRTLASQGVPLAQIQTEDWTGIAGQVHQEMKRQSLCSDADRIVLVTESLVKVQNSDGTSTLFQVDRSSIYPYKPIFEKL